MFDDRIRILDRLVLELGHGKLTSFINKLLESFRELREEVLHPRLGIVCISHFGVVVVDLLGGCVSTGFLISESWTLIRTLTIRFGFML